MVVGEDILIDRLLGALAAWYGRKKDQKEAARKTLVDLRIAVKQIKLHMDLSRLPGDGINYGKLKPLLPGDVEYLFKAIETHKDDLDLDLTSALFAFQEFLVHFVQKTNLMGIGNNLSTDEKLIESVAIKLDEKISDLLKDLG